MPIGCLQIAASKKWRLHRDECDGIVVRSPTRRWRARCPKRLRHKSFRRPARDLPPSSSTRSTRAVTVSPVTTTATSTLQASSPSAATRRWSERSRTRCSNTAEIGHLTVSAVVEARWLFRSSSCYHEETTEHHRGDRATSALTVAARAQGSLHQSARRGDHRVRSSPRILTLVSPKS